MIKAIIIDDEDLARELIRNYLDAFSDIEVAAECANGLDALRLIRDIRPDLIFLDIQMPKVNGFEVLELLDQVPEVIFSTAFDHYAIEAFEKNAADYLLKPYSRERFDQAVEKARGRLSMRAGMPFDPRKMISDAAGEPLSRIVVRAGAKIQVIDIDLIEYFQATDDYVEIHCQLGKFLKQITMKYLESHLDANRFVRVHRSYILSINKLTKIEYDHKKRCVAVMQSNEMIPISRSGYGRLREILNF